MNLPTPDEAPAAKPGRLPAGLLIGAVLCFVVSGATGLVYEVAWTRRLLLLLGSTSSASCLVLAAFLGGLGIGAVLGGRLADRHARPLLLYGLFEVGGALWALLVPDLLAALETPYVALASGAPHAMQATLRGGLAVLAVVPGAAAVGATFPALLRALARGESLVGPSAVVLYGANTLGAVAGALWAGFHGVFEEGVRGSTRLAAAAAAAVGLIAAALGRMPRARRDPAPAGAPSSPAAGPLWVAALSGFLALGLEAAGVRILVFFVEGFTASFAAMLATFLAGLALGSLVVGPFLARRGRPSVAIALLLLAAGAVVLASVPALPGVEDVLHGVRDWAYRGRAPVVGQRLAALAGSALLFLPPALLLGAVFPLTVRWAAGPRPEEVGRAAGRVYLANSLGSVLGPLAVLLAGHEGASGGTPGGPLLAWAALGTLAVAGAAVLLLAARPARGRGAAAALAGAVVLAAAVLVPGVVRSASPEALVRSSRVLRGPDGSPDPRRTLVEVRSDDTTTASVVDAGPGDRTLYTDEFAAASTGAAYAYMRMLGHLPVLCAARPARALVIAFGTGTTAGAVAEHRDVERLEVVETSRAVLDLAPRFAAQNGGVLDDPRVETRVEDGRNALLLHAPDLDVITLEPLMPYTPAALPFYTREFYALARDRLRDGGVLCQWVPVHAMPLDLYQALVGTFFEAFPEGSLWFFEQSTLLVGSKGTARPAPADVVRRAREVAEALGASGLDTPAALALGFVATGARVRAVLADPTASSVEAVRGPNGPLAGRTVTDDTPFPEAYPSPRAGLLTSYLPDTLLWLAGLVTPQDSPASAPAMAVAPPDRWPALHAAAGEALMARAVEAIARYRLAAASAAPADARGAGAAGLEEQGRRGLEDAAGLYARLLDGPAREDANLRRRRLRLDRARLMDAARDRLRAEGEARARGDPSSAATARDDALLLARRAYDLDGEDPVTTGRPAAAALYGEALLLAGRCAEAQAHLEACAAAWPSEDRLADLAAFAAAHRRGAEADLGDRLALVGDLARRAPPCGEEPLLGVRPALERLRAALRQGDPRAVREAADAVVAAVDAEAGLAEPVAREVRALGAAEGEEAEAERVALVAALAPADPALAERLRDPVPARYGPALRAAAHRGFERTHARAPLEAAFALAPDPARRLAFASAAAEEGSPWALVRVARLLDDPQEHVREGAWGALARRMPPDRRAAVGFDPRAPEAERRAAAERAAAWAAEGSR